MDTSDELDKLQLVNMNLQGQEIVEMNNPNSIYFTGVNDFELRGQPMHQNANTTRQQARDIHEPAPRMELPQFTRAEEMVREVEKARAQILNVPGKSYQIINPPTNADPARINIAVHSSFLDEDYLIVGNYIDENTKRRIGNGEYVDFAKLMPKDKLTEDDHRMEMVNRGGYSYWVPIADRELTSINNFNKWEQAFRVFSNIYTSYHPSRAGELIQYNHIIHTASQTFLWENVYRYDREFCIHMSCHHMNRSWVVILQQAWSMFLKDKVNHNYTPGSSKQAGGSDSSHRSGGSTA